MKHSVEVKAHQRAAHLRDYSGVTWELTCTLCGEQFTHEAITGRKPIYCPECAAEMKRIKAQERQRARREQQRER